MVGVGKTELAIQYALRNQDKYSGGMLFVDCQKNILEQIISFRKVCNMRVSSSLTEKEKIRYCWEDWNPQLTGNVLLVYDDVDNLETIKAYMPTFDRFKVIVTTRNNINCDTLIDLKILSSEKALELLNKAIQLNNKEDNRVTDNIEIANQLCKWLGNLPLALDSVSRYLVAYDCLSLDELFIDIERKDEALLEFECDMTAKMNIIDALNLAYDKLSSKAKELGCYLSLFENGIIDWSLVIESGLFLNEDKEKEIELLKNLRDKELCYSNFLTTNNQSLFYLHPLIRLFFTKKLKELKDKNVFKHDFIIEKGE
jgi:tetratricopeptide (TPR) repeat protein